MVTLRADHGGGPKHVYDLIENLPNTFEVFVAAPDEVPYWERFALLTSESKMIKLPHRKFAICDLIRLVKKIRKEKIDIIHSHGKGAGIYSRLAVIFTGKKCIHTFHGIHLEEYGWFKRIAYIAVENILSIFTSKFINVSQSEKEKAEKNGLNFSSKTVVINNGVRLYEHGRKKREGQEHIQKIVTVSRFDFSKNTELITDILLELRKKGIVESFIFHIAGDGPGRKSMECKLDELGLSKYVVFEGFLDDLKSFYLSGDCYLSTSRFEGLPISVLEAMSYGLPVVCTDVTGNKDLIDDGLDGLLFSSESGAEAAECLLKVKTDTPLAEKFSVCAYSKILNNFDIRKKTMEVANLYQSLVMV